MTAISKFLILYLILSWKPTWRDFNCSTSERFGVSRRFQMLPSGNRHRQERIQRGSLLHRNSPRWRRIKLVFPPSIRDVLHPMDTLTRCRTRCEPGVTPLPTESSQCPVDYNIMSWMGTPLIWTSRTVASRCYSRSSLRLHHSRPFQTTLPNSWVASSKIEQGCADNWVFT